MGTMLAGRTSPSLPILQALPQKSLAGSDRVDRTYCVIAIHMFQYLCADAAMRQRYVQVLMGDCATIRVSCRSAFANQDGIISYVVVTNAA